MNLIQSIKPTRRDKLPWREMDGRAVIIDPKKGKVHELNPAATLIWKTADGSRSLQEIAELMENEFEISLEQALADAVEFLAVLKTHHLMIE